MAVRKTKGFKEEIYFNLELDRVCLRDELGFIILCVLLTILLSAEVRVLTFEVELVFSFVFSRDRLFSVAGSNLCFGITDDFEWVFEGI